GTRLHRPRPALRAGTAQQRGLRATRGRRSHCEGTRRPGGPQERIPPSPYSLLSAPTHRQPQRMSNAEPAGSPGRSVPDCRVPAMTSAARHEAAHPFDHLVQVPELRNVEIPFDQAPGLTALAARADRHEVLHLARAGDAPALLVMTEDAFEQAVQDAAD